MLVKIRRFAKGAFKALVVLWVALFFLATVVMCARAEGIGHVCL